MLASSNLPIFWSRWGGGGTPNLLCKSFCEGDFLIMIMARVGCLLISEILKGSLNYLVIRQCICVSQCNILIHHHFPVHIIGIYNAVADPGFSSGGANSQSGCVNLFVDENCMKMKEFGPGGRPWHAPLGSPNAIKCPFVHAPEIVQYTI